MNRNLSDKKLIRLLNKAICENKPSLDRKVRESSEKLSDSDSASSPYLINIFYRNTPAARNRYAECRYRG